MLEDGIEMRKELLLCAFHISHGRRHGCEIARVGAMVADPGGTPLTLSR
jgi:hypothetical protein